MRIFCLLLGILCTSIALFLIIIYLNLLVIGYSFFDFVYFIIRSGIILVLLLGIFFIYKGMGRAIRDEFLLRYSSKLSRKKL